MLIGSRSNTSKATQINLSGGVMTTTPNSVTTPILTNLLGKSMFVWTVIPTGGTLFPNVTLVSIRLFPESGSDATTDYPAGANFNYAEGNGSLLINYASINSVVLISSYLDRGGDLIPFPIIAPAFQLSLTVGAAGGPMSSADGDLYLSGA